MTPGLRKLVLTTHITVSVGWVGAVAGFLVLSIAALTSRDAETARGAYLAMNLIAWFVIVPFALGSLFTGIVQSLGTTWGLFRHYWVAVKLLLTAVATTVLLLKMKLIGYVAGVAVATSLSSADLSKPRMELAVHSGGGLLVLLVITTLSVFKPWGLTRYGQWKLQEQSSVPLQLARANTAPLGLRVLLAVIGVLVAGFIVLHLTGHGSAIHTMHHH